jgi:heme exporter protein A
MSVFAGERLGCIRGERVVFAGLSFHIAAGSALTVTGPNGAGKSSLLRLMAGLLPPAAGTLTWNGASVTDDPEAHRRRISWLGHADAVKPGLTAVENATFWATLAGRSRPVEAAADALGRLGLGALLDTPGRYLSQGQRRRVALSRLLVARCPLWILDEPTVGLDAAAVALVEGLLARHLGAGGLAVLATHVAIALPDSRPLVLGAAPAGGDPC